MAVVQDLLFGKCKCGCERLTQWDPKRGCWYKYASGCRKPTRPPKGEIAPYCPCGCGQKVGWRFGRWNTYVTGHNNGVVNGAPADRPPKPPLCQCGCGDFVGANARGKWLMYIEGHLGANVSRPPVGGRPELCQCGCGQPVRWDGDKRRWRKYKPNHHLATQAFRDSARKGVVLKWQDPTYRKKMASEMVERWQDPLFRDYMSDNARKQMTEQWKDEEYRQSRSIEARERHNRPEWRERAARNMKQTWVENPEWREMHSHRMRALWKDPEYRQKATQVQIDRWTPELRVEWAERTRQQILNMGARNTMPNKLESLFNDLTSDMINFVGTGAFTRQWPNGRCKNPDFRVTGQRRIIELFGDYWHAGDDVQLHMEMWKRLGYECLVIWEHELHEGQERILDLVSAFIGEEARSA